MTPFYDLASIHHDLPLQNSMIVFVLAKYRVFIEQSPVVINTIVLKI